MSHYTTELRYICEHLAGLDESVGFNNVNTVIENSRDKLFNFDFPIYDETYRSVLETKIIKHYYTHEIGSETVGLFQLRLDTRMNEIMPYYNELYRSAMLEFNPLYDVDITETHEGSGEKTGRGTETKQDTENRTLNREDASEKNRSLSREDDNEKNRTLNSQRTTDDDTTTSGTGSNTNYNLYSQTPQGGLSGVNNEEYLTDARKITDASNYSETNSRDIAETGSDTEAITDNTTSSETEGTTDTTTRSETEGITKTGSKNTTDNVTTTDEYIRTIKGKRGGATYAKMIMEYRKTLLNIDMMIIKELANLFMLIW